MANGMTPIGIACTQQNEIVGKREQTVRENLDERIEMARRHVELLCVAKAKAETAQILDYPMSFIQQIAW